VLDELPEKIEDVRTCVLSEDQVKLYRETVAGRGAELARQIETAKDGHLPYLHVFSPCSRCSRRSAITRPWRSAISARPASWPQASGTLFQEILEEALGSGQKWWSSANT